MAEAMRERITQRRSLALGGAALLATAAVPAWRAWRRPSFDGAALSPEEAHAHAVAGDVLLIDIRRPDEWARTGIGDGAHPLDMRRADFAEALASLAGGDRDRPIALICAAGVRSARLARRLTAAGFAPVVDVPEGMTGGIYGPGWIARGLPVRPA